MMLQLKHSVVRRGGSKDTKISFETREIEVSVVEKIGALCFDFQIASKGGGNTSIELRILKGDIDTLLHEIATRIPETAVTFLDCAGIAVKKLLLNNAQK
jgi:hypothetical protein